MNPNDYGIILSSKYNKKKIGNKRNSYRKMGIWGKIERNQRVLKSKDEIDSPLKRWKKHASCENQGRIQLMSNVFYSS